MASNSILKLQVDDKQYEASLKNAQQGLTALQAALRNSGKSFADVDKQTEQYVRELGKMEATAKTTRGRIGEMSSAFVELSRIEKQLTDQERQSPVGKAMTESLAQLKQRTIDAKNELHGLENQIKNVGEVKLPDTGGLFSGDKLSGMLQVFGGNLMTKAAGAIANLGSEMVGMVQQGVEMAKAGEGIRVAFERLGRGDILDGLREATHGTVTDLELMKAAVKFNDFRLPIEELGTMLAFAQQKAKDTGQSVDYMVDSIVTGLGRKSLMILDNLGLSAAEIKEKMKETGDMTKAVGEIIREQMAKAGDYVETAADRAAQANVSLQNKMEELGRKFGPVEEASNQLWTSMKIGILDVVGGPLARLLNGLTEAGRLKNALNDMNGDGSDGKQTKVQQQLSELRYSNHKEIRYNAELERYNRPINKADELLKLYSNTRNANVVLPEASRALGQKFNSISELEDFKKALIVMRDEYRKGAKEIMKPVKPVIDTSDAEQNVESLKIKLAELEAQRKDAVKKGDQDKVKMLSQQINQTKTNIKALSPTALATTHTETPQQRAERTVSDALQKYNDAVALATKQMEAGNISDAEYQRQMQSQQQRLYDAYGQAYRIHTDQKYKDAQQKAADEIVRLGGAIKQATEEQQAVQQAARQLEQAQKKLAEAQAEQAKARQTGELKAINTADKKVAAAEEQVQKAQLVTVKVDNPDVLRQIEALKGIKTVKVNVEQGKVDMPDVPTEDKTIRVNVEQGKVDMPDVPTESKPLVVSVEVDDAEAIRKLQAMNGVTVTADIVPGTVQLPDIPTEVTVPVKFTSDNLEAFKAELKEKLDGAEYGSQLYKDLTAQLADATAIGNLMNIAIKEGIDFMQFHPAELWSKIFGKNPGDYITDDELQSIIDKLNKGINGKGGKGKGKGIKLNFNTGEIDKGGDDKKGSEKSAVDVLSQMNSGMNNVVSSLTQLGVEIPTGFKEMLGAVGSVFGVLQGIATIVASINAMQEVGTFLGIFAQGGIVPHMADGGIVPATHAMPALPHFADGGLVPATHAMPALPHFADGGIIPHAADGYYVPGNRFSGDTTPILANAGELVLSKAAQGNLASMLEGTNLQNLHLDTEVTAESIRFVLNNRGRRTGKGEYVQSRFYRH